LNNDHGKTHALRIFERKVARKIYVHEKKILTLGYRSKEGDKGHTARGRYSKIY
jgi:hypothetical protein